MKKFIFVIVILLIQTACSQGTKELATATSSIIPPIEAKTTPATSTPYPSPTIIVTHNPTSTHTRTSTKTATLTTTPIPSPTVTPLPQPINASTLDKLSVAESYNLHTRGFVKNLLWTPDGGWILAQTDDRLDVIDPNALQITTSYAGFEARHFIRDGRLFGVQNHLPVLLDLASGKIEPIKVNIPAEQVENTGFDLSQDGKYFAIPVDRFGFDVITLATGDVGRYDFLMNNLDWFSVMRVSFSYDGTLVIVHAKRKDVMDTMVGIELKWGDKLYEYIAFDEPIFSLDGQRVIFSRVDGRAETFIVANGELWSDLSARYSNRTDDGGWVSFSRRFTQFWNSNEPQGYKIGILYQGTYSNYVTDKQHWSDSQLLIYDTRNDDLVRSLLSLPALIQAFTFSPDGKVFILATEDGDLSRWDTSSGVRLQNVNLYDVNTEPQISPDGQQVAYSYHTTAQVFSLDGNLQQVITPTLNMLDLQVRFIDTDRLALFYRNTSSEYVEYWDLTSGKNTFIAPYIAGPCDFSLDGNTMACREKSLRFLDTHTGEWLMDVSNVSYYAVSPDQQFVAHCNTSSPSIFLAKRKGGAYQGMFTASSPEVCGSLAFSPDSTRLASGAGWVWNVSTRKVVFDFQAANPSAPLVYGPQGDIFFVGGEIFDSATGTLLAKIPLEAQAVYFSKDGTRLIAINQSQFSIWTTR